MPKSYSGKFVVKILCREFGFFYVSQKGSHVKLRKNISGKIFITIVPLHKELARGTFFSILELAGITEQQFKEIL